MGPIMGLCYSASGDGPKPTTSFMFSHFSALVAKIDQRLEHIYTEMAEEISVEVKEDTSQGKISSSNFMLRVDA